MPVGAKLCQPCALHRGHCSHPQGCAAAGSGPPCTASGPPPPEPAHSPVSFSCNSPEDAAGTAALCLQPALPQLRSQGDWQRSPQAANCAKSSQYAEGAAHLCDSSRCVFTALQQQSGWLSSRASLQVLPHDEEGRERGGVNARVRGRPLAQGRHPGMARAPGRPGHRCIPSPMPLHEHVSVLEADAAAIGHMPHETDSKVQ